MAGMLPDLVIHSEKRLNTERRMNSLTYNYKCKERSILTEYCLPAFPAKLSNIEVSS